MLWRSLSLAALVGLGLALVVHGTESRAGTPRHALYVSPSGSDSGRCTRSSPCRTFARAYGLARSGQMVRVLGGTYDGKQKLFARDDLKARVVFAPAPKARVVVNGSISIVAPYNEGSGYRSGGHVEFRDISLGTGSNPPYYVSADTCVEDVVFRRVNAGSGFMDATRNISVIGGRYGGNPNAEDSWQIFNAPGRRCDGQETRGAVRALIDGAYIHSACYPTERGRNIPSCFACEVDDDCDPHNECIQTTATVSLTVRNSTFVGCGNHAILAKPDQGDVRRLLIENNIFVSAPRGYFTMQILEAGSRSGCEATVRNNSFHPRANPPRIECNPVGNGIRMVGNIIGELTENLCDKSTDDGARWEYNVFIGDATRCGGHANRAGNVYRAPGRGDFSPTRCSGTIDRGSPHDFARRDIRGRRRPSGRAPDAGAFEARGRRPARCGRR